MKKIEIPEELSNLGNALSAEEMKTIIINRSVTGTCTCKFYMTNGNVDDGGPTKTYGEENCKAYCEFECSGFMHCYKFKYYWAEDTGSDSGRGSGSGSGTGSGSGSGSQKGSGSGSQDPNAPDPETECLCWKKCDYYLNCDHRREQYECRTCYCTKRCIVYNKGSHK